MQVLRSYDFTESFPVSRPVRTLLLAAEPDGLTEHRLSALGARVEVFDEMYAALDAVLSDPGDYGLFVIAADGFGGLDSGLRAHRLLGEVARRLPTIVVTGECREQIFPQGHEGPTILRAPLSSVSLRVGFEHALRARLAVLV